MTHDSEQIALPDERAQGATNLRKAQLVMLRMLVAFDSICSRHDLRYWLDGGTLLGAIRHAGFIPWDDDIDLVMPRSDYESFLRIAPQELPTDMYIQTIESDANYRRFTVPCRIRDRYSRVQEAHQEGGLEKAQGVFLDVIPADKYHLHGLLHYKDRFLKFIYYLYCEYVHGVEKHDAGLPQRIKNVVFRLRPALVPLFPIKTFRSFLKATAIKNESLKTGYELGYSFDSRWRRYFKVNDLYPLGRIVFEGHSFRCPSNPDGVLKVFYGSNYMRIPEESHRALPHYLIIDIDTRADICDTSAQGRSP